MTRRTSIYTDGFNHRNPIPNACRIGHLLVSGVINGVDPETGALPATLDEQSAFLFVQMRRIVEAGGGCLDDVIKMTVWMRDPSQREPLNREWLKTFPDPSTRPARHTLQGHMRDELLIQCDFTAVIGASGAPSDPSGAVDFSQGKA